MIVRSALLALVFAAPLVADPAVTGAELLGHIKKLASEEWEGRATGSAGEKKATDYIQGLLESFGLEPAGENGTWFQTVSMPLGFDVGKDSSFSLKGAGGTRTLKLNKEFRPLSISSSGIVEADCVFAGFGISAGDDYDDYADLDVKDKIVFVFRHAPTKDTAWNRSMRAHSSFVSKQVRAQRAGAAALVIVNSPRNFVKKAKGRSRPDVPQVRSIGSNVGKIPFVHMTLAAAEKIFPKLFGTTPTKLEDRIYDGDAPHTVSLVGRGRVRIVATIERTTLEGRNVCAILRAGSRKTLDGVLVVGAHHDHVGRGVWASLERDKKARKEIHNGADDNASGTSGLLETAEYLASIRDNLQRDVLFITFTGEERGLVGSKYWCANPTLPLKDIIAMINMDMIGRLGDRRLFIGGTGTSPVFEPLLTRLQEEVGLKAHFGKGGRAPSDNTSFYNKGLPVLFFFTGLHEQYHRPGDDWNLIDVEGITKVATLAARMAEEMANAPTRPKFTRADGGGAGPPRPRLGISLDRKAGSVTISATVPDGAAAKGGLKAGDVILAIAGKKTPDQRALRGIMRNLSIGQKVTIKIRRGKKVKAVEIELGS